MHGQEQPVKDYFEPGIPPELDLSIDRSSTASDIINDQAEVTDEGTKEDRDEDKENEGIHDDELCKQNDVLSSITEEI